MEGQLADDDRGKLSTYAESLDVVHGDGVAEQVEKSILKHASVAVATRSSAMIQKIATESVPELMATLPRPLRHR